ncbi:hypothetical protein BU16DRAFT_609928 [Lophium mytilinum]|uniref:Uncharacterized protein n=1 Tax=Lophium mytilinum TaxID=390894 RepID=A0A6A6QRZ6_9PEZI|nr:hypothetical protein BU16DRAFT_609928 [Lophium mytilinum]
MDRKILRSGLQEDNQNLQTVGESRRPFTAWRRGEDAAASVEGEEEDDVEDGDGTMGWAWAAAAIAGSSLSGSRRYWGRQATMSSKHQRGKNGRALTKTPSKTASKQQRVEGTIGLLQLSPQLHRPEPNRHAARRPRVENDGEQGQELDMAPRRLGRVGFAMCSSQRPQDGLTGLHLQPPSHITPQSPPLARPRRPLRAPPGPNRRRPQPKPHMERAPRLCGSLREARPASGAGQLQPHVQSRLCDASSTTAGGMRGLRGLLGLAVYALEVRETLMAPRFAPREAWQYSTYHPVSLSRALATDYCPLLQLLPRRLPLLSA